MILVEVTKFVVEVEWSINLFVNGQFNVAHKLIVTLLAVGQLNLLNFVRHYIHDHSKRQERDSEDNENSNGRDVTWDWAPGR